MQVAALIGFPSCPGGDCSTFDPATDGVGPNIVFAGRVHAGARPEPAAGGAVPGLHASDPRKRSHRRQRVQSQAPAGGRGEHFVLLSGCAVEWCAYFGYAGEQRPGLQHEHGRRDRVVKHGRERVEFLGNEVDVRCFAYSGRGLCVQTEYVNRVTAVI